MLPASARAAQHNVRPIRRVSAATQNTDPDHFFTSSRDREKLKDSVPKRKEWTTCSVPTQLLLERCSLKVRRQRLRRGMCLYCGWFIVLLALAFSLFTESTAFFTLLAASVELQQDAEALDTNVQPRSSFARIFEPTPSPTAEPTTSPTRAPTGSPTTRPTLSPTASPTAAPTASPTTSPTASPTASPTLNATDPDDGTTAPSQSPIGARASPRVIQPLVGSPQVAHGRELFDMEFYAELDALLQDEENDLGIVVTSPLIQDESWWEDDDTTRRMLHNGTCDDESCWSVTLERSDVIVFPDEIDMLKQFVSYVRNLLFFRLCQPTSPNGVCNPEATSLQLRSGPAHEVTSSYTLPSQVGGPFQLQDMGLNSSTQRCFNGFVFGASVSENQDGFERDLHRLECPKQTTFANNMCTLRESGWRLDSIDLTPSADGFLNRMDQVNFITEVESVDGPLSYYSNRTRFTTLTISRVNYATESVTVISIDHEITLGGLSRTRVSIVAASGIESESNLETSPAGVFALVFLTLLLLYIALDLIVPLCNTLCGRESLGASATVKHLVQSLFTPWDMFDVALVIVLLYIVSSLGRADFADQVDLKSLASEDMCLVLSHVQMHNNFSQLFAIAIFLFTVRSLKYISLFPRLELMWAAISKGVKYFSPACLILMLLCTLFALILSLIHHHERSAFKDMYSAITTVVTFYGDASSMSWAALMTDTERQFRSAIRPNFAFYPLVFLFKFFIVLPFTAVSISAFFFALAFTDSEWKQKRRQQLEDDRAATSLAILANLKDDNTKAITTNGDGEARLVGLLDNLDDDGDQDFANGSTSALFSATAREITQWTRRTLQSIRANSARCLHRTKTIVAGVTPEAASSEPGQSGSVAAQNPTALASAQRRIGDREVLNALRIYTSHPDNSSKVLISYDELDQLLRYATKDRIFSIMELVGRNNIYKNSVKRKFDAQANSARARGEKYNVISSADLAQREGRSRMIALDGWVETKTGQNDLGNVNESLLKIRDNNQVGLNVLALEFDRLQRQQHEALTDLSASLNNLKQLREMHYATA